MKEKVLYFIWKYQQYDKTPLISADNKLIEISKCGIQNVNAGPDFLNASLIIDKQKWVGNVEIHEKSSDWYLHNHHLDDAYNAVILHVVWEHDMAVFNKSEMPIPTLELKNCVKADFLKRYNDFVTYRKQWVLCENQLSSISKFEISNWLEKLFFERLERKYNEIAVLLAHYKNDWEAVLFLLLAKNFGSKINSDAFFQMAKSVDIKLIRKERNSLVVLESLFFGQANLLIDISQHNYPEELKKTYSYLKSKYTLVNENHSRCNFFRLRPSNFPTIRLAQLAQLYNQYNSLFLTLMEAKTLNEIYGIFQIQASEFWDSHYTFETESPVKRKKLTKSFIDTLVINTVVPLKFAYHQQQKLDYSEELITTMQSIKPEKNSITTMFENLQLKINDGLQSQALLQLKNEYCNKNRCLECAVGKVLLNKN